MKQFFLTALVFCTTTGVFGQANTQLSNLISPTSVNQSLLPSSNSKNLGSSSRTWKTFYLQGSWFKGSQRFLSNSGLGNTFLGLQTGVLTIGTYNTAVGDSALYLSSYGNYNTAVGYKAMSQNVGGSNTAMGYEAIVNNTSGVANTAIGNSAMLANTTGGSNTALGSNALQNNNTGNFNIAIGQSTLFRNTASQNTSVGYNAMPSNTTGAYNTSLGGFTLLYTTTAQYNTAVGYRAGSKYDNGYNNVFVGANTDVDGVGYYNVIAIGQGTICTSASQVTMGNPATSDYRAYAAWRNISDGRYKRNLQANVPGLSFINKLRPVTYTLDASGLDAFLNKNRSNQTEPSTQAKAVMQKALKEKEALVQTGFVAQEVEKAAKELNYNFSGVAAPKNSGDVYSLSYSDFVVPLVKAVQELDSTVNAKDKRIDQQQQQIDALIERLNKLEATQNGNSNVTLNFPSLEQNTPNPVSGSTTIRYHIPTGITSAVLNITNAKGQLIKTMVLSSSASEVSLTTTMLASGTYNYTLVVDGKQVDTKRLVIAR